MSLRAQRGPLGPDSITWRHFGDWRSMLVVLWAGAMQNMHPHIGTAVMEHSQFFSERWERIFRSFYPILGVVYDGPGANVTAARVRAYHQTIRGRAEGAKYHALAPETFYWAHAVFFMTTVRFADRFMGGVSEADQEKLFLEHVQWYRLYGLTMKPVPATWNDFRAYWACMCDTVLEDNTATRDVLNLGQVGKPPILRWVPLPIWNRIWALFAKAFVWLTVGLFDPAVRRKLGYSWVDRDEKLHRMLGWLVHCVFMMIPHDRRYHPRARAAWRRSRGKIVTPVEASSRYAATESEEFHSVGQVL
jgi:uncharacterized protein (DUF2236 family)